MTEKRRVSRVSGRTTPRYRVVRGYFYPLVLTIEPVLSKLEKKLFAKALIDNVDLDNAGDARQLVHERARALLDKILKKIELEPKNFEVFVNILRDFSDIAYDLDSQLKKEEECSNSHSVAEGSAVWSLSAAEHSRSYSDSDAAKLKIRRLVEADSGFVKGTQLDDSLLERPEEEGADLSDDLDDDCFHSPSAQTAKVPIPSEGRAPPNPPSLAFSGDVNRKMENIYLKSENEQLKDTIEDTIQQCKKEVIEQGHIINQKDDEIENLKRECAEKDERVGSLERDKAKMEKTIYDLRTLHVEVKPEIITKESYEGRIKILQESLKEAEVALNNARAQLRNAKCEKLEELDQLREKYGKLNKLVCEQKILREQRKAELATKDKEIAEHKAELAEHKAELAEKKVELAEIQVQEERRKSMELIEEMAKLRMSLVKNGDCSV